MSRQKPASMRVLAIDPGYERVGIAIIEKNKATKERVIFSECFRTSIKLSHGARLALIGEEIERVIDEHKPTSFAIEELFFNENRTTAIKVAEARGVAICEAAKKGLDVFEYTPLEIKIAVTGYGRSEKCQVISMVKKLIDTKNTAMLDDEFDAIAIGLTHIASYGSVVR